MSFARKLNNVRTPTNNHQVDQLILYVEDIYLNKIIVLEKLHNHVKGI